MFLKLLLVDASSLVFEKLNEQKRGEFNADEVK